MREKKILMKTISFLGRLSSRDRERGEGLFVLAKGPSTGRGHEGIKGWSSSFNRMSLFFGGGRGSFFRGKRTCRSSIKEKMEKRVLVPMDE